MLSMLLAPALVDAAPGAQVAPNTSQGLQQLIVVARSDAEYDQLRTDVQRAGG